MHTHISINLYIYVYIDTEVHKKINIWTCMHTYNVLYIDAYTHSIHKIQNIYIHTHTYTTYTSVSKHELITHTLYFLLLLFLLLLLLHLFLILLLLSLLLYIPRVMNIKTHENAKAIIIITTIRGITTITPHYHVSS